VVDIQNDFCPGGSLSVPRGHEVVPLINRLAERFEHIVLTQDWHPPDHLSFASAHPGKNPYDTIVVDYGPQILWPDHCVQATRGAEFHKDLCIPHAGLVLRKGIHRKIDSYSTFYENDRKTPTGLMGYLRDRGFTRVFLAGSRSISASAIPPRMRTASNSTWWSSRTPAEASMSRLDDGHARKFQDARHCAHRHGGRGVSSNGTVTNQTRGGSVVSTEA
jgi:hypothetical protein